MLIDFKLLLFELNCQLFFFFLLCRSMRERVPYLIEGGCGGVTRGKSLSYGNAEEMSGLYLKMPGMLFRG